jgi:hypothetical protein
MPGMDSYTEAAVERAMKVQEVMLQAMAKKITWSTRGPESPRIVSVQNCTDSVLLRAYGNRLSRCLTFP